MICKISFKPISVFLCISLFLGMVSFSSGVAYAEADSAQIEGSIFDVTGSEDYEINESTPASEEKIKSKQGRLCLTGELDTKQDSQEQSFSVKKKSTKLVYEFNKELLSKDEDKEHIVADKNKRVNGHDLDDSIGKGTVIIETSLDNGKNWFVSKEIINQFNSDKKRKSTIYTPTDMEILNGCRYRITIAYKTEKNTDPKKVLFVKLNKTISKQYVETYEFSLFDSEENESSLPAESNRFSLGEERITNKEFVESETIPSDDVHFGWEMGQFFMGGYAEMRQDPENKDNVLFLKTRENKLVFWYHLNQNVEKCNENENLSVSYEGKGVDQRFNERLPEIKRGILIIRKKNPDNTKDEPVTYTDFLKACGSPNADVKIQLFEEGDYEVALDYVLRNDNKKVVGKSVLPKKTHYTNYFSFSVRNSNSMIQLKDTETGLELFNHDVTKNGFALNFNGSKYLKVNIERKKLGKHGNEYVWDTVRNIAAKDGDSFKSEGLYSITIENAIGEVTEKTIYVISPEAYERYRNDNLPIETVLKKELDGDDLSKTSSAVKKKSKAS